MNIYAYTIPMNESFYFDYAISGLRKNGHTVITKNMKHPRELEVEIVRSKKIDLILFYGFSFMNHIKHQYNGDSFFLPHETMVPYAVHWCDDPRRYEIDLQFTKDTDYRFFMCDSLLAGRLKCDFPRSYYLPTFYDPDIQRPMGKVEDFRCELAYAGTVLNDSHFKKQRNGLGPGDIAILDQLLDARLPGKYYDYVSPCTSRSRQDLNRLLQCALMEEKNCLRMDMFHALRERKMSVFGQGDGTLSEFPNFYRGRNLDQHSELPMLYNSADISLSIELLPSSVHQRIMECCGCGGFILGEDKADMAQCFDDFVVWKDLDDLRDKVTYYLGNETERRRISESMHTQALERHTAQTRMKEMIDICLETI